MSHLSKNKNIFKVLCMSLDVIMEEEWNVTLCVRFVLEKKKSLHFYIIVENTEMIALKETISSYGPESSMIVFNRISLWKI